MDLDLRDSSHGGTPDESDCISGDGIAHDRVSPADHSPRGVPNHQQDVQTKNYLTVHRVICTQLNVSNEDHKDHDPEADYFDVPRLFANDTRGSKLRGRRPLDDLEDYWEDHPEYLLVVVKEYLCTRYQSKVEDSFELIATGIEKQAFHRLRPWLYQLQKDAIPAEKSSESIHISESLSSALSLLVASNQPHLGQWLPEVHLKEPYDYFYHFRQPLRRRYLDRLSPTERIELLELLDFIDATQGSMFDYVERTFASGKVRPEIFGKLFAPNEVVITTLDGLPRALIAEKVVMSDSNRTRSKPSLMLECSTWTFDGSFRKSKEDIKVTWPVSNEETVSIQSLAARPLRLDKTFLRESLLKRGKEFWSCRHRKLVSYNAPEPTVFELQITNPKYMIDYRTYRQMHPAKAIRALATEQEMKEMGVDMDNDSPPSDLFCMLLPPTMLGYAFHDKKWRSVSMQHVEPVPWNKEAFNRLVLKSKKKETIKALVTVHLRATQNVDVVENKGNGLIILLHGSPGTGKTLTAESVAEIAEKPLYRVTCGDVGTTAETVERYMESVLLIGTIWECVVLLDEADVFLEERQVTDLARNALVSVFLRVLEYYDGILILTTNRVGTFDEAFKSRIQLAVHFPTLDEEGRYEIWLNFINVLKEKNVDLDSEELKRKAPLLARTPFNGRQIRNNLWTAAQVAKYKNERLDYSHLEQVVEIAREFEDYLKKTHGQSDEENARAQGLRGI